MKLLRERISVLVFVLAVVVGSGRLQGQESRPAPAVDAPETSEDLPSADLRAGGDALKRYFLAGPAKGAKVPADGFRLLVVLPGGTGTADFHPFVRNIRKQVLTNDYLVAQPIAISWTQDQTTIWPRKMAPVKEMKFTTEEFVDAVIADVAKRHKLDRRFVFTLSWSSGGPAAYAIALRPKTAITGSYVAMAVFHPKTLPPLGAAKGHAFFIDHSPEDEICKFALAEQARDSLKAAGAKVEFVTYPGGHGWHDNPFVRLKKGIAFLEKNHAKPPAR